MGGGGEREGKGGRGGRRRNGGEREKKREKEGGEERKKFLKEQFTSYAWGLYLQIKIEKISKSVFLRKLISPKLIRFYATRFPMQE